MGKVLVCVFFGWKHLSSYDSECQGMLSSALSSVHFARFTFPEGVFFFQSCSPVTSYNFFVLGLGAKSTVIELQQTMMKILGLLPLSVMENST